MEFDLVLEERAFRILIVEDGYFDRIIERAAIARVCPKATVFHADTIHKALIRLKDNEIDLILLDLNLPDGYGPQTVADIRAHNKDIPIIVISDLFNLLTKIEAKRKGADYVLRKSDLTRAKFKQLMKKFTF